MGRRAPSTLLPKRRIVSGMADEGKPAAATASAKSRIFRQKAIAGGETLCPARRQPPGFHQSTNTPQSPQHLSNEIRLSALAMQRAGLLGIDRDRANPHLARARSTRIAISLRLGPECTEGGLDSGCVIRLIRRARLIKGTPRRPPLALCLPTVLPIWGSHRVSFSVRFNGEMGTHHGTDQSNLIAEPGKAGGGLRNRNPQLGVSDLCRGLRPGQP